MCFFQLRILSVVIPRSLILFTFSRDLSLNLSSATFCSKSCNYSIWLVVNNIVFVLVTLNAGLFPRFYIFRFALSIYCSIVCVLELQLRTQFFISVMDVLNNTGPKISLCGTPNFKYKRFEKLESICTNGFCLIDDLK